MNARILTRQKYWNNLPESVKSMWQHTANKYAKAHHHPCVVCTMRPDLREYRGTQPVRRCSTGGRWGKSADVVNLSIEKLLADGYVWKTYIPAADRLAAKRDAVYSSDEH